MYMWAKLQIKIPTLLCISSSSCRLASMAFLSCLSSALRPRPAAAAALSRLDSPLDAVEVGSCSPWVSGSSCPLGGHSRERRSLVTEVVSTAATAAHKPDLLVDARFFQVRTWLAFRFAPPSHEALLTAFVEPIQALLFFDCIQKILVDLRANKCHNSTHAATGCTSPPGVFPSSLPWRMGTPCAWRACTASSSNSTFRFT